ncbi:MAG TPA: NAD(P)-dependent oxidoreductase [Mycobacteriales bacterium]|jgi:nucleoside-diphosphate-sugar epimerase|nr:NAD(P)-dependent oxidoreductase [Mycobacteriales bacterium]
MKIFVAGSTGVAGREVVAVLRRSGHGVTAAVRSSAKSDQVRGWGAEPATVDLFDPATVRSVVAGHDAICNLTTHIPSFTRALLPRAWADNDRIRREVSANLVDAALATGVPRLVQESIGFLYADRGDGWITEQSGIQPNAVTRSAADAENNVTRFIRSGGTGVIVRFGFFYGPANRHTADMISLARRRIAPTLGDPNGFLSSLHTDDVGTAVAAALGAPAGTYNVSDDEPLRRSELHLVIAEAVGRSHPHETGQFLARLGGTKAQTMARSQRLSNAAFKAATGWSPTMTSAHRGWPAILAARTNR